MRALARAAGASSSASSTPASTTTSRCRRCSSTSWASRAPDVHLEVGSASHAAADRRGDARASSRSCSSSRPDWWSSWATSTPRSPARSSRRSSASASRTSRPGLRSFDRPCPRRSTALTDAITDLLFTPSADGVDNLRREGVPAERDPPRRQRDDRHAAGEPRARARRASAPRSIGVEPGGYACVTLHRPVERRRPASRSRADRARLRDRRAASCRSCSRCTRARASGSRTLGLRGALAGAPGVTLVEPARLPRLPRRSTARRGWC